MARVLSVMRDAMEAGSMLPSGAHVCEHGRRAGVDDRVYRRAETSAEW